MSNSSPTPEPKLCIDCAHCLLEVGYSAEGDYYSCTLAIVSIDYIKGNNTYTPCVENRKDLKGCRHEGRYFEEKRNELT